MKGLMRKDLYVLLRHARSVIVTLGILALALVPTSGAEGFVVASAVLFTMLTLSTFSYDEAAGWERYALILPVERAHIVRAKYGILYLLAITGAAFGALVGGVVRACMGELNGRGIVSLFLCAWISVAVGAIMGGMAIVLTIRFGTERARLYLFLSALLPVGIGVGIYQLLRVLGVSLSGTGMLVLLLLAPVLSLLWNAGMYALSCRIFARREL